MTCRLSLHDRKQGSSLVLRLRDKTCILACLLWNRVHFAQWFGERAPLPNNPFHWLSILLAYLHAYVDPAHPKFLELWRKWQIPDYRIAGVFWHCNPINILPRLAHLFAYQRSCSRLRGLRGSWAFGDQHLCPILSWGEIKDDASFAVDGTDCQLRGSFLPTRALRVIRRQSHCENRLLLRA